MKTLFFTIILSLGFLFSFSQSINNPFERQYEFEIHQDAEKHTQIKPYFYYLDDSVKTNRKYKLNIAPVYSFKQNYDLKTKSLANDYRIGAQFNANYNKKVFLDIAYFYGSTKPETFFTERIDSLRIIPSIGGVIKNKNNQYRYDNFVGSLTYKPAGYIYFQIGKGKVFLGDGYRSLILSDNSLPAPYFKTIVEVWKVKYLYMISQLKDYDFRFSSQQFEKKYNFTHYLSFNIGKRFNFSLFETVVTSPYDSIMANRGLELNYLNPVIFMRSVEYSQGSPDNCLVGVSGHLKIFQSGMLYGQVFIDEFIYSHIKSLSEEYWDEKYGVQAGMKFYKTFGIENLYSQAEFNAVRPFTYSHLNPIRAYTNTYQPLSHPLGSNFVEGLGIIGYQFNNYFIQAKAVYSRYGENDTLNYGRNPTLSYTTRNSSKDVKWLQGEPTSLKYADLMLGYKRWNTQFSMNFIYRNVSNTSISETNLMMMLKIETPLFNEYYDYD